MAQQDHTEVTPMSVDAHRAQAPVPPMTTSKPIVVGVDGSAASARAVRWAAGRGRAEARPIVAVHVLTYTHEFNRDLSIHTVRPWRQDLRDKLQGPWTEVVRHAGLRCHTRLVEADSVATGLLRVADQENTEVIVVGAHARGHMFDRVVGTVTYQLAHRSRHPVVIVPAGWVSSGGDDGATGS
jgi:nucleotide-binding universal stress UspA family protein